MFARHDGWVEWLRPRVRGDNSRSCEHQTESENLLEGVHCWGLGIEMKELMRRGVMISPQKGDDLSNGCLLWLSFASTDMKRVEL
jgi:hypothetical protein